MGELCVVLYVADILTLLHMLYGRRLPYVGVR